MDKKFNNIIRRFKEEVVLSKNEKERLWSAVDAYVYNHPEKTITPMVSRGWMHILSPYFLHTQRVAVLAIAVVFIVGGGTSLMAQDALPNDALYAIKVNVNEEVRSWFAFGAESRAYFETKRASERLQEAKTLAVLGELDTESKEKIKKNLEKHAHKVQEQIATVEANNDLATAIDISKNFEQSLKEQTKTLAKAIVVDDQTVNDVATKQALVGEEVSLFSTTQVVDEPISTEVSKKTEIIENPEVMTGVSDTASSITNASDELIDIVDTVEKNIEASAQVREEVEAKIPTTADENTRKVAAETKRADAVLQIEKVSDLIATTTLFVDSNQIMIASSTLDSAKEYVVEGDKKLQTETYGEAFVLFKNSFDTAVRAEHILVPPVTSKTLQNRNR